MRRLRDAAKYSEGKVFTEILESINQKELNQEEKQIIREELKA